MKAAASKTERLFVSVGKWEIEQGLRSSCRECPVAIAIRPFISSDWIVEINGPELTLDKPKSRGIRVSLPPKVSLFIRDFDQWGTLGGLVRPISFNLQIPRRALA